MYISSPLLNKKHRLFNNVFSINACLSNMWKTGGHLRFQDGRATVLQLHVVITPSKSEFSWDPTPVLPSGGLLPLSPLCPTRLHSCVALWWSFVPQSSCPTKAH